MTNVYSNFFNNKDHLFANYLILNDAYLFVQYGKTKPTSVGEYYLSDLEFSTRKFF